MTIWASENPTLIALFTAGMATAGALFLLWRSAGLRGTTLVHAGWWSLISLAAICAGELLIAFAADDGMPHWATAVRLITGTATFCPLMAVLGARRPHHHAWQFVVVTMWMMLSLPAWEALFLRRLEAMDVGPVRGWFLWLMIAINLATYLPTRFWMSAILVTLGQLLLLGPFLPGVQVEASQLNILVAMIFFTAAIARICCCAPASPIGKSDWDHRWLTFRDNFGTMWALRVVERINAAAQMYDWPLSLTWTGFYFHDPDDSWANLSPQVEAELRQTMDNLLRRFH